MGPSYSVALLSPGDIQQQGIWHVMSLYLASSMRTACIREAEFPPFQVAARDGGFEGSRQLSGRKQHFRLI